MMNQEDIRARFTLMAALPDHQIKLDEAALLIAAETDADVDIDHSLALLDQLAERFESMPESNTALGVSVSSLNDFIHREEGFTGNVKSYYAPENSYLNRVLNTRQGIPITLALVHIAVGDRLQIPVRGMNFPGHFLVRYGHEKQLIVDPFTGRFLSETDCATLLKQIAGPQARILPHYFDAAPNKSVLLRILDNLKQIFWRDKSWTEVQKCVTRQLLLRPGQAEYLVQLAAVYEMQGKWPLATQTYLAVLQNSQDDQMKEIASKRLLAMETTSPTIH